MLENWYELARIIPGHNATVFETRQLEIYEISAFLKATWKCVFGFVFLHNSCCRLACMLLKCNLGPNLRSEISKHSQHPGGKLTRHSLEY